ncbi:hemerythrin domain-containing protein [Actinoplanes friuliensis]|uniref:Hemerythrin-like protein n=1 Tax=Actinoplanes friuliensis DSM 7358 TaxID=1246995 RepID=U5W336_9ACTN|nr:hemerythrin domain-containing protein [Actinoplanes friuliensis]AGZ42341.1 hemerythrin-like protein [Actinoplanes friuliensis DSM 7358]
MDDITALIMEDHHRFRVGFARLDDAEGAGQLAAIWEPLALHLDIHADAEEEIFYPHLLKEAGGEDAEEETDDAIGDHNKIRDGIEEARKHPVGSDGWWAGVWTARKENSEHLMEEEDEVLPDFRKHATPQLRADLAVEWLRFFADHPQGEGLDFSDKDPKRYIAENS